MNSKKLTEKINGRREWSIYGLDELSKQANSDIKDSGLFRAIIITNALSECAIKNVGHRTFKVGSKLIITVTKEGVVIIKGLHGEIERVNDPITLFDRLRIVWGNH